MNCSSPTWHKDNARKERRATKRLEADRKDLEERLLRLEANQARLENGIYERNPRRLTKKQPIGSTRRSSSANTERSRSSAFSALFSASRRSSRSRASSVTGDGTASQRHSSDTPPTLSLTLPERFGTAVSRELATRHGNFLLSTHQAHRTIHLTPKLDDLRENWRTAEAWQRKHAGPSFDTTPVQNSVLELDSRSMSYNTARTNEAQSHLQGEASSADLSRERFTSSLPHAGKPLPPRPTVTPRSSTHTAALGSKPWSSRNKANIQIQQLTDTMPARVATARQLHELTPKENVPASSGSGHAQGSLSSSKRLGPSQQIQGESASQVQSKVHKTSTLATDSSSISNFVSNAEIQGLATKHDTHSDTPPRPPHLALLADLEETKSHSHSHTPVHSGRLKDLPSNPKKQSVKSPADIKSKYTVRQAKNESPRPTPNGRDWTPSEIKESPGQAHVLKHAGRSVSLTKRVQEFAAVENHPSYEAKQDVTPNDLEQSIGQNHSGTGDASRAGPNMRDSNSPTLSRSLTDSSSQASYNTADEEVLNVTQSHPDDIQATDSNAIGSPKLPTTNTLQVNKRAPKGPDTQRNSLPPPAQGGPVTVLRKRPKQKVGQHLPDQMVAKVFVICCRCKYWHDMPSEVYARLACPERLPSDSILARTFTRRNSVPHKGSLRSSLLSADPSEKWRLSAPRQQLPTNNNNQAARESRAAAGMPLTPPSCCWCGHNMSRSCCQGWTTLVQMRERHH